MNPIALDESGVDQDGKMLNQKISNQLSLKGNLIILCGHYKGVDQRVRDSLITMEISIGDYVLSSASTNSATEARSAKI